MSSLPKRKKCKELEGRRTAKQPKFSTSVVSLNYDVLIHIFKLLDRKTLISVASVCKDWNAAAYCKIFWKRTVCSLGGKLLTYESAKSLYNRGIQRVRVTLYDPRNFTRTLLNCAEVVKCETLYLYYLPIDQISYHHLPKKFNSLKHMALCEPVLGLNNFGISKLLSLLVNLRQLHIKWGDESFVSPGGYYSFIKLIFFCLPNLNDLELLNDKFLPHHSSGQSLMLPQLERLVVCIGGVNVGADNFLSLPAYFPGLKHLVIIPTYRFNDWNLNYKDKVSFQSLESLTLGSEVYWALPRNPFLDIFRTSRNLKALNLTVSSPFKHDEDFEALITSLPNLSVLIYGHTVSLVTLNKLMPKLKNIEMLASVRVLPPMDQDTAKFIDIIPVHMPKLFSLLDVGADLTDHLDNISNVRYISDRPVYFGCSYKIIKKQESRPQKSLQGTGSGERGITEWVKVLKGSADWHEAVCTRWFNLPDTFAFDP